MPQMAKSIFTLREPSRAAIDAFLLGAKAQSFSYPEVGSTRGKMPSGYTIDHNRIALGAGKDAFDRAVSALRSWTMFNVGWARLLPPGTPIEAGRIVAVAFKHFGFWSKNALRIVYVIEEDRRAGFAYGTLQQHAECGEERFSVEWNPADDSVVYDILAFSRPRQWQARIANPVARMLQKRFVRDSMAAMKLAVASSA
jgi:uncharacterized protein (UPF0548 family)